MDPAWPFLPFLCCHISYLRHRATESGDTYNIKGNFKLIPHSVEQLQGVVSSNGIHSIAPLSGESLWMTRHTPKKILTIIRRIPLPCQESSLCLCWYILHWHESHSRIEMGLSKMSTAKLLIFKNPGNLKHQSSHAVFRSKSPRQRRDRNVNLFRYFQGKVKPRRVHCTASDQWIYYTGILVYLHVIPAIIRQLSAT